MTGFCMKRTTVLEQVNNYNDQMLKLKAVIGMVSQTLNELFLDKFAFFHYSNVRFTKMVRIAIRFDFIVSKGFITYHDSFSSTKKNF